MKKLLLSAVLVLAAACFAESARLKDGDRIAVIGDSITEQKLYSVYLEFYLRACSGVRDLSVIQFGHGGEHASGYAAHRMNDTCSWFRPTVATVCYGMNDGQYRKVNDRSSANYRNGLRKIASWMNQNHIRLLISSPGAVDTATFRRLRPDDYNQTLAVLGGIAKETAAEFHAEFADLHSLLLDVMRKAKAKYGESYHVCGADGIHPARNGHLVMAYSMLKGLGMDGKIAEIKMDYPTGKTQGSTGHQVVRSEQGRVTLASTRWPFCFWLWESLPKRTWQSTWSSAFSGQQLLSGSCTTAKRTSAPAPEGLAEVLFLSLPWTASGRTVPENSLSVHYPRQTPALASPPPQ